MILALLWFLAAFVGMRIVTGGSDWMVMSVQKTGITAFLSRSIPVVLGSFIGSYLVAFYVGHRDPLFIALGFTAPFILIRIAILIRWYSLR